MCMATGCTVAVPGLMVENGRFEALSHSILGDLRSKLPAGLGRERILLL